MKKLIVSLLIICLLFCSGCTGENLESRAEHGKIRYEDFTDCIVADKDTHILYIKYSSGYSGFLSPYYSKNGKLCIYEDGKITEVKGE